MADDKLTPADPRDVETCLSLALTSGRSLARSQAAEVTAKVVAERLVSQLEASGFVVMRRPIPMGGSTPSSYPERLAPTASSLSRQPTERDEGGSGYIRARPPSSFRASWKRSFHIVVGQELIPAFVMENLIEDQAHPLGARRPILPLQRDWLAAIGAVSLQFLDRAHLASRPPSSARPVTSQAERAIGGST
jgi:hypothetical protein